MDIREGSGDMFSARFVSNIEGDVVAYPPFCGKSLSSGKSRAPT
jgi:hypothetical protein